MPISDLFTTQFVIIYFVGFLTSSLCCWGVIRFGASRFARHHDLGATQSMHSAPTPRIGGTGLFAGLVAILIIVFWTPWEAKDWFMYLVSIAPLFAIGLMEDIGLHMSPVRRFAAIVLSSLLTVGYWGIWVQSIGVPGIDALLTVAPIAIALTVLMAAGVTNAFNLIDGLNGLAGFTAITTAISLGLLGCFFDHFYLAVSCALLVALISGFLVFNFPYGKIFLGDGGAYLIGHTLVWFGIGLIYDVPQISPFAILLIFFWPVADTLLAMWRRQTTKKRTDQPDRLHVHQVVLRLIEIRFLGRGRRRLANPLTTVVLLPFVIGPQIAGVLLATSNLGAAIATCVFAVIFFLSYKACIAAAKDGRRKADQ